MQHLFSSERACCKSSRQEEHITWRGKKKQKKRNPTKPLNYPAFNRTALVMSSWPRTNKRGITKNTHMTHLPQRQWKCWSSLKQKLLGLLSCCRSLVLCEMHLTGTDATRHARKRFLVVSRWADDDSLNPTRGSAPVIQCVCRWFIGRLGLSGGWVGVSVCTHVWGMEVPPPQIPAVEFFSDQWRSAFSIWACQL